MKKISLMMSVVVGTTVANLALESQSVYGANLRNGGTNESAFIFNNSITKIGEVEGQAGGVGKEIFFGFNGASTGTPQSSIDLQWIDEKIYNWKLTWDATNNKAELAIAQSSGIIGTLNYTFASNVLDRFNAFGLITRADNPSSKVKSRTTIKLSIDRVAFSDNTRTRLNRSVKSTSGTKRFDKQFFILSPRDRQNGVEITSMSGTFAMNWNAINPQRQNAGSRVAFEIKMFDPPVSNSNSTSVISEAAKTPEPSSMLGLLVLGALGATATMKRKSQSEKIESN
ncbi:hypothetical protein NIES593_10115 [Hydrococcus rivularis NIES-593]|uniref:Ice-binding protein C-terminal domain-containing protein n=1 Tax=Hydrococcus rivularis NIES-593 TaxID=1921803 RepID=A0A1U7HI10_9CYAN|nr:PEP-CTERM sorting domain-containing protein [Hydrococcus rivularis]OKH23194.1 hypothetical protein NIES593_10115 [Hydrococcus rivularis NIES-593]